MIPLHCEAQILGRSKKKIVILLQPRLVDGRVITPNLFTFFMVPIHPNLQRIFFCWGVRGRWLVGTLLVEAR